MAVCTFFDHRDCLEEIKAKLRDVIVDLINNQGVDMFYVGHQGQFDGLVHGVLKKLQQDYPTIRYAVVLAYMPSQKREYDDYSDTMLPEGIESVHPHYAISWRNKWMLEQSDFVVTYITHSWGGAAQYANKAKKQGKTVINIVNETK